VNARASSALLVTVALLGGCSVGFVKRPPRADEEQNPIDCTDSYAMPVLDTVLFASSVAVAILGLVRKSDCGALDCLAVPFGIAGGILFPLSAADGYDKVHGCKQVKDAVRSSPPEPPPRPPLP
jgi:hypothetical protein